MLTIFRITTNLLWMEKPENPCFVYCYQYYTRFVSKDRNDMMDEKQKDIRYKILQQKKNFEFY